ncbi:hypothetical protein SAMN04487849_109113 [Micrococcus luteus]|uniref:Pyridoxamine 5'-phosphate oxidase putative domain-containing protein n=1 Tax=Micrococcus luteus TaxID=1270 RepID=A0ABD7M988_MICLU|nr:pyridoxamine 5'-phosphate oxidase family protein [Micrococcus luteus]SHL73807.1 hypothetical protein SAMN04487849_109113 [Micrococcus luteus]
MKPRSTDFEITTRAAGIIKDAGYLTVATTAPDSTPWAAQLQYAWFTDPLRFVVGSAVSARHTRHVLNTGVAAAALSTLTGTAHGLDGLQMAGDCRALSGAELTSVLEAFYQQMFTDPAEARAQALPVAQLDEGGPQRLLELRSRELWILDLDRWETDGVSARRAVDIETVESILSTPSTREGS